MRAPTLQWLEHDAYFAMRDSPEGNSAIQSGIRPAGGFSLLFVLVKLGEKYKSGALNGCTKEARAEEKCCGLMCSALNAHS